MDNYRACGLFVQYHGLTGELLQCIRMREQSLLPTTSPEALEQYNPDVDCDLDRMQEALERMDHRQERATLKNPAARALANGEPIERVLEQGAWQDFHARLVQSQGLLGPDVACVLDTRPASELVYASPYLDDPDSYLDLRWSDGVYARIPKRMTPQMDDVCLELGALTASGDLHRVMAVGSRSSGNLHTTVYEKWSRSQPASPWGTRRTREASSKDNEYR